MTEAVRDATIGGRKVKRGQTIALDPDDGLLAAGNDREKAVLDGGRRARRPGSSCSRCSTAMAPTWPRRRRWRAGSGRSLTGVEVEVRHGGQPFYRYLIAAE